MYRVLARRWRPQTFDELVGQSHVARTLANAVSQDRLAHAYLFAGVRGTGKTTVARILAKCLNCEKGPTTAPCGVCAPCCEIAESRAIDVLEIDAASRTKVEQTRELLEVVSYAPVRDRNKILIIDEAHMLSKASFNALLKTLEEPPPNVVFVLATTEIQKILPTILSRCQVFEFRRVAPRELAQHLRRVCDGEQVTISDAALDRIARAGEGSVRDSLTVLERVLAFAGDQLDDEEVLRVLGTVSAQLLVETVTPLAQRDAAGLLRALDRVVGEGHDLNQFWNELLAALRDLLLLRTVGDADENLLARPPEEAAALEAAAEGLSREDLLRSFQIVADLEPALRSTSQPRFLFEACLIRLAALGHLRPIEEILASLDSPAPAKRAAPARPAAAPTRGAQKKKTADTPATPPAAPARRQGPELTEISGDLATRWLRAVEQSRPMLGAVLERASQVRFAEGKLSVGFTAEDHTLAETLQRPENLAALRQHAEQVAGAQVQIDVARRAATQPTGDGTSSTPPPVRSTGELLEAARQEPGVRQLLREFGAQVLEIRPLAPDGVPTTEDETFVEDSE